MAYFPSKSSVPLIVTLLVAFGLQAGAVKILLNLGRQSEAEMPTHTATTTPASAPTRVVERPVEHAEKAPPPPPITAPTALIAEPPPEARPAARAPNPEVAPAPVSRPTPAANHPEAGLVREPVAAPVRPTPPAPVTRSPEVISEIEPPRSAPTAREVNPEAHFAGGANTATSAPVTTQREPLSIEVAPQPAAPTPAAGPTAKPVEQTPPAEKINGLQDISWLKARSAKNYTIQIYSGRDLDKLKEIAATTPTNAPVAYFQTGSRTNPWYSLIIGDYPDAATARSVADTMRIQSSGAKPWVRRFDDIQGNLR